MGLNLSKENVIKEKSLWTSKGYRIYDYDRDAVIKNTLEAPEWIHFGAGNIFRAFQAALLDELLEKGIEKTGLIAAEGFDYEIIEKMYRPHDNLSLDVTLKANGTIDKAVIGSIAESLTVNPECKEDYDRIKAVFRAPSLKMVSFTITEKGYSLVNAAGEFTPQVAADFAAGPSKATSYMGKVTAMLYERYKAGQLPVAMVSMDNCSHNGDKLYAAVHTFAEKWNDAGFLAYVENGEKVSFPWSMIDKITPRPDASVEKMLLADGIEGLEPVITSRNTYVAPFVNAEECQYLVIEDSFPNGKIALDKVGVIYTARETVDRVEKMKVCTCLNPLHTALAVYGCLLNYQLISKEMENPTLKKLVERIGYDEGLPVVVNPGVLDPKHFIDEVVKLRIPNPFMPDSPWRIATDTSQKVGIRYGETIKAYVARPDLDPKNLKMIPLVFAGWLRYLMGINDDGETFEPSSDPLLDSLRPYVSSIKFGDTDIHDKVYPILSNASIFGSDLYAVGLGDLVESYFTELIVGPGAVRKTLEKYV